MKTMKRAAAILFVLVLAAGGLTFQEVESVLDGVLLEGKSTDEIPVIMEKMRNITSTVYGEDDE